MNNMKQRNQTFGYVVLLAGLALIFTGFFLFVPEVKRNDVFWLDLSTVCLVFIVSSLTELGLFGINFDFEKQVSGLGIRLVYIRFYSLLAITIITIGYFADVHFRYQLFFQLLAAFILLVGYFFSHFSSGKAMSVQVEQDMERKGKDEILRALNQFDILFTGDLTKWLREKQKINFLKEDVRYLSPTNSQSAADIDSEIANTIQQAYAKAREKNEGGTEVISLLNKCEELLKLRKNTYSK
jgi:hypothetical protein